MYCSIWLVTPSDHTGMVCKSEAKRTPGEKPAFISHLGATTRPLPSVWRAKFLRAARELPFRLGEPHSNGAFDMATGKVVLE